MSVVDQRSPGADPLPLSSIAHNPLDRLRTGFPALTRGPYLSVCDKAILHDRVRAGVDLFLDRMATGDSTRVDHETYVTASRARFAALTGVTPQEVAVGRNVSDGINAVLWAIDWREGDNAVVALDAEHPNNLYPWLRLKKRGVTLRNIPAPGGCLDHDAMIAALDDRTRVVSCASVSFAPGYWADLGRLGRAARARDVLFLVDGVQSAGILCHDFPAEHIDAFATSTSKGLLGLYGYGFLYVAARWIDRLEPTYLSRPAIALDTDDASATGSYAYRLQPDARRFEVGSYNLAGAYAADASLALLEEAGAERVEARALHVAAALREALSAAGLDPVSRPEGASRAAHIVTAGRLDAGGHGFSDTPWVRAVSARLSEAGVVHTVRRGQLRFATHFFNTEADAAVVRDVLRDWRGAA